MIACPVRSSRRATALALAVTVMMVAPLGGAMSQARSPVPAGVPATRSGAGAPPPVSFAIRIAPDTVRIGEPFLVVVRVRVPQGATVTFPVGPDSGTAVEALDPRALASGPDSSGMDLTATYRLAAWDLGRQPIGFAPVTVHGGGVDGVVPLGDLTILVAATTPTDAAHRVPRAARAMFVLPRPWWPRWAIAGAALLGVMMLWLVVRRWRSRPRRRALRVEPFVEATRDFAALDRVGLLDAGEAGRYVTLAVDIARIYLVRRLAPASMALTTAELMGAIGEDARVPRARLGALLAESDRIKFARYPLSEVDAKALGAEARRIVEEVDRRAAVAAAAATATTPVDAMHAPGSPDSAPGSRGHAA